MNDHPTAGIDWRTDAGRAEGRRRLFEIAAERDRYREALEFIVRLDENTDDADYMNRFWTAAREAREVLQNDGSAPQDASAAAMSLG